MKVIICENYEEASQKAADIPVFRSYHYVF